MKKKMSWYKEIWKECVYAEAYEGILESMPVIKIEKISLFSRIWPEKTSFSKSTVTWFSLVTYYSF